MSKVKFNNIKPELEKFPYFCEKIKMADHNELGKKGEQIALDYLTENGFVILEKNWHWQGNEIDIIARQNESIVFVEVKTRKTAYFGQPEVFVTRAKQRTYIKLANEYVLQKNYFNEVRFDIISVLISDSKIDINHIEAAFSTII